MVRDSHLTHGGLRMTNTTAGTFTELKETSPQRVLSPLFPHSRQARMGSPKWRHPLMFVASLSLLAFPLFLTTPTHADSITVSISGNPTITVAPTSEGTFADSGNITIGVTSTASSGYTLSITGSNTSLTGTTDSTKSIVSIPTNSSLSATDFNTSTYNNMWGYKPSKHYDSSTESVVDNSNYLPSPTSNGDIIDIVTTSASNDYTMSIGARITNTIGFQSYENNTFVIAAVGNSKCNRAATTISEAICMQDMNDNVINSMTMNQQYQLIDERDDKTYYIAKMKDGRVWMTRNLDLDLVSDTSAEGYVALTSDNTDLNIFNSQNYTATYGYSCSNASTTTNCTADGEKITWVPATTTLAKSAASSWSDNNYTPYSYDYEDYYYYTNTSGTNTAYDTESACTTAHNDGTCPHYHVGNYYNFTAAVASNSTSGITANYTVMGNSVCPAGWKLPNGVTSSSSSNVGYYGEANYTWRAQGIINSYAGYSSSASYNTNGYLNLSNAPLYLTRSGYKYSTSNPSNMGSTNFYQNDTIYNSSQSYASYFSSLYAYPGYYYGFRSYGYPIRCIARQSNTGSTTITFDKNANDATGTMSIQTYNANTLNTLPSNGFSRSGYALNSWNTKVDGSGDSFTNAAQYYAVTGTATDNVTLYAQWDPVWKITFNANGGTGSDYTQEIVKDASDYLSGNHFTRSNYYFKGWSTSSGENNAVTYRAGQSVAPSSDMTLYAVWASSTSNSLYNIVASLNKATLTNDSNASTGVKADITKDNSGVFTYDSGTFGTPSDAATSNTVYTYRGILDDNLDGTVSTYGSNGNSANYPNYVKLGNICWRIVRTTGSGGVKMIYNGLYSSGTTANSCANTLYNAQLGSVTYLNRGGGSTNDYGTKGFVTYFGYNYNRSYGYNYTSQTSSTANSAIFNNNAASGLRSAIENWYTSNLNNYSSGLETSAGYCNDRTTYSGTAASSKTTSNIPYKISSATVYSGAYLRNYTSAGKLSLTCPNDTGYDLLTTSNGLGKPVALLTADETALAGSGNGSSYSSNYHNSSFLRSGSTFWLLSPGLRNQSGSVSALIFSSKLSSLGVGNTLGMRPAISLKSGTNVSSGSGTATDPWVVEVSFCNTHTCMQDLTSSAISTLLPNVGSTATVYDARDEQSYTIAKLADGKYWMTKNLNLAGGTALSADDTNVTSAYISSFSTSNNLTKNGNTIVLPASSTSGFDTYNYSYVYNSGNKTSNCTSSQPCYSYYSWDAATLGSGRSIATDNTDAQQSICPKGWRLPTSRTTSATNWQTTSDFYAMAHQYGLNSTTSTSEADADFYNNAGPGTTPNFLLAGEYSGGSFYDGGSYGSYWSSTSDSNTYNARYLSFNNTYVYSARYFNRSLGNSVRCLFSS